MVAGRCMNTLIGALALGLNVNSDDVASGTPFAATAQAPSNMQSESVASVFNVNLRKVLTPEERWFLSINILGNWSLLSRYGQHLINGVMMYTEIYNFWFAEITPAQRWKVDAAFDDLIRSRFAQLHEQANQCELYAWRHEPKGRLAEIIVLDQFSRNMFRGMPAAFASDNLALALAQEAVAVGADQALTAEERVFLYMPYMHSESKAIHEVALKLFEGNGIQNNIDFELRHKAIVDRFGRYPHRNEILGRTSTAEEIEFLKQPGSSF